MVGAPKGKHMRQKTANNRVLQAGRQLKQNKINIESNTEFNVDKLTAGGASQGQGEAAAIERQVHCT